MAPLSHHLQDSTHTSFGVVTTGFVIDRVKLEASAFNGREPNEKRWSIQLAALDSWSTRASIAPSRNWTAQYSIRTAGTSRGAGAGSQWRQTASVEYNRPSSTGHMGYHIDLGTRPQDRDRPNLNGYLLESTVNFETTELRVLAVGVGRQRRVISASDCPIPHTALEPTRSAEFVT